MSAQMTTRIVAVTGVAGVAALTSFLSIGMASVSAAPRKGHLHLTKECPPSTYAGAAGDFCTITVSNLSEIKVDSRVVYDQAFGIPSGLLDSNVVLDAGNGDRALGRCTLDSQTGSGLCTFSDGTGQLAGFHARVDVSFVGGGSFELDGTYSFSREADRDR
jgi:hypothetical protein